MAAKTKADSSAKPYHHGSLREALLQAAEAILEKEGVQGLTLRAAARDAGASHAAPKNHFGDLTGLLSALAAVGFNRFSDAMVAAAEGAVTPGAKLSAIGHAYVDFAVANPGLFQLMFRSERLDPARPALREAMDRAAGVLADSVSAVRNEPPTAPPSLARGAQIVSAWSLVHGFAMLLLDGRLQPLLDSLPAGETAQTLLQEMLDPCGPAGHDRAASVTETKA